MAETLRVSCAAGDYTKIADDGEFFRLIYLEQPGRFYIGDTADPGASEANFIPMSAGRADLTLDGPLWFMPTAANGGAGVVAGYLTDDAGGGGGGGVGAAGSQMALVSATFNRPADTNTYAIGDLVANNTTAGSVVAMNPTVSSAAGKTGKLKSCVLYKTTTTTALSFFRVHFFSAAPTVSNGDNGAFVPTQHAAYLGAMDVACSLAHAAGASGVGVPVIGDSIPLTTDTIWALIEARAAYAPGNAETFGLQLNIEQNL